MTKIVGKENDGFYVETEALRRDAKVWEDETLGLREGRESIPLSCVSGYSASTNILISKCMDTISTLITYCSQGEAAFHSTATSLKQASNDYEATEVEIFRK